MSITAVEEIFNRLSSILGENKDSAIASVLGVPSHVIANSRARGTIPYKHISDFAEERDISLDYLLLGRGRAEIGPPVPPPLDIARFERIQNMLLVKVNKESLTKEQRDDLAGDTHLIWYHSAKIYNRVSRFLKSDDNYDELIDEEIDYLIDIKKREYVKSSSTPDIKQEIHGNNNQVAGRDIKNKDSSK